MQKEYAFRQQRPYSSAGKKRIDKKRRRSPLNRERNRPSPEDRVVNALAHVEVDLKGRWHMQVGHLPVALSVATYDWNPRTIALCVGMHFMPNLDALVERSGVVKPGFHCTVTHSILFASAVSGLVAIWSPHYGIFTLAAILSHYAADIGSTVGLPLLWPFVKKRYTLALFKDTGYWGSDMLIGYYRQPMSWVVEGAVTVFFVYRLFKIGVLG